MDELDVDYGSGEGDSDEKGVGNESVRKTVMSGV
jgi:hypothetical protein